LGDERLIFKGRLECSLAGLGLIGSIGSVKLAARREVVDDRGNEVVVASSPEEAGKPVGSQVEFEEPSDSSSLSAEGTASGRSSLISGGTTAKRSSSDPRPIVASICATSSGVLAM
jgi:hypothetical protein